MFNCNSVNLEEKYFLSAGEQDTSYSCYLLMHLQHDTWQEIFVSGL